MAEPTDVELVELARGGDLDAYGKLVRRHHGRVAGLCHSLLENRSDVDDAAQAIFMKAYRSIGGFRGNAEFATWLYRITINHCRDVQRRNAGQRTVSLDAIIEDQGEAAGRLLKEPVSRAERAGESEIVQGLITKLPDAYREALRLRIQGLDYEQIAAALECTVDAVKARLRRARSVLSENLRHFEPPDASKGQRPPEP